MVNNKLREKEMILKQQTLFIEQQFEALNIKLHQIQNVMHNISLKEKLLKEKSQTNEKQILQREMELALKERLLLQKTDRLHKEQNNKKKRTRCEKNARTKRSTDRTSS